MRSRLNLVLAVLVAACGASLWWAGRQPPASPADVPVAPAGMPSTAPEEIAERLEVGAGRDGEEPVRLVVLNATSVDGLAADVGHLVNRLGCVAVDLGNAPAGLAVGGSLLVNRRLSDARARKLASRLGGLPVLREFDADRAEDAVLVLGADAASVRAAAAAAAEAGGAPEGAVK